MGCSVLNKEIGFSNIPILETWKTLDGRRCRSSDAEQVGCFPRQLGFCHSSYKLNYSSRIVVGAMQTRMVICVVKDGIGRT